MFAIVAESSGNPNLTALGVDQGASTQLVGGNLEGKDVRFGPASCGLWAASTTGTSNGSVNCMHDSMTPIGGMMPMLHMMLGEVSPGGVGVGLMGILIYALLAVFIAGLMVGRTPEYLGKKIQAAEMKLVVLYLHRHAGRRCSASPPRRSCSTRRRRRSSTRAPTACPRSSTTSPRPPTTTARPSPARAPARDWYTMTQGLAMLIGRFFLIIPALAIGGSLVRKQHVPVTAGTFPTDSPAVRRPRCRGDRDRRRPDLLPRPRPRPDRRAVDA